MQRMPKKVLTNRLAGQGVKICLFKMGAKIIAKKIVSLYA